MMPVRYPKAEWVPWKYQSSSGPTYYLGVNRPVAVVLHIMQGYLRTAREWALTGHYGASWHFSVGRDGTVLQHLDFPDGGYHAGIPSTAPAPTWPLWRGHGQNVNHYTIGVEHEGFTGTPFAPEQAAASRDLCRWLARELAIPMDEGHFPPHAVIDIVNRRDDFNRADLRAAHYRYLFEEEKEDEMTEEQVRAIVREEIDRSAGTYYKDLTRKYWLDVPDGDFSEAPETDVVEGMRTALFSGTVPGLAPHTHVPGGVA